MLQESIVSTWKDMGQEPSAKLEFKQRVSIALGAAKGKAMKEFYKVIKIWEGPKSQFLNICRFMPFA